MIHYHYYKCLSWRLIEVVCSWGCCRRWWCWGCWCLGCWRSSVQVIATWGWWSWLMNTTLYRLLASCFVGRCSYCFVGLLDTFSASGCSSRSSSSSPSLVTSTSPAAVFTLMPTWKTITYLYSYSSSMTNVLTHKRSLSFSSCTSCWCSIFFMGRLVFLLLSCHKISSLAVTGL